MAIREFEIHLLNNTPYTLIRVTAETPTGSWASEPPGSIAPGAEARWMGQSEGWFRGTEGLVRYQIQDGDTVFGDPTAPHQGRKGCLEIHHENPYWGRPHSEHRLTSCEGVLDSGDPEPDYVVKRPEELHTGTDPDGFLSIDGIDYLPGIILAPIPEGHIGSVWTVYILERKPLYKSALTKKGLQPTGPPPGPKDLKLAPIRGGAPWAFNGVWADVGSGEPQLRVDISGHVSAVAPTNPLHPGPVSLPPQSVLYAVDLADKVFPLSVEARDLAPTTVFAAGHKGDIWTHPETGVLHVANSVLPVLDLSGITADVTTQGTATPVKTVDTSMPGIDAPAITTAGTPADTLTVQPGVVLQLYGDLDPDGQLVRYRLRYLRTKDDGTIMLDVMLWSYTVLK